MVTVRRTIAGVALIAAVTGDVTAPAAAGHVQITAPGRADQFNPLGSRRRKKSN
jgi:hypothetical protein